MPKGNILLVTYYWPPAGGVAVQRWLHMANHLQKLGWQVIVIHPQNASYPQIDDSLSAQIDPKIISIPVPIWEPNSWYPKSNSSTANPITDQSNWWKKLARFIRANWFVPDARMFWITPVQKAIKQAINEYPIQVIISNGTPHSDHVAVLKSKGDLQSIPWVADFRDPWLEIDYFDQLPMTSKTKERHKKLENEVITTANAITTVSPSWKNLFSEKGANNVQLFTNGYDQNDFKSIPQSTNDTFLIRHIGSLTEDRNPSQLWEAFATQNQNGQYSLELIGPTSPNIQEEIKSISSISLRPSVNHPQAIEYMKTSDALLLVNNKRGAIEGRIPAKVFEYMASQKPIIYIGSKNNDAYSMLLETIPERLIYFDWDDEIDLDQIKIRIESMPKMESLDNIAFYERGAIAKRYSDFLETIIAS